MKKRLKLHYLSLLQPEEMALFILSLMYLIVILIFSPSYNLFENSLVQINYFREAASWFFYLLIFIPIIFWFDYVRLLKKGSGSKFELNLRNILSAFNNSFLTIRIFIFILVAFALALNLMTIIATYAQNHLMNAEVFEFEKRLFGTPSFIWVHHNSFSGFLNWIAPAIIFCFFSLSFSLGFTGIVLAIKKEKTLFSKFILANFVGLTIAILLWFLFPLYSPNNYYLAKNNYEGYGANNQVKTLELQIYQDQKSEPPISTLPSMHVITALLVVYFLFSAKKKTLFFTLPWFALLFLGTFFLGQHYLVDGLLSIPIVIVSIYLADLIYRKLLKLKKYTVQLQH